MRIRLLSFMTALFCVPLFALAPQADARAGRGASMGSRGSHTWSAPPRTSVTPNWNQPINRSVTPPSDTRRSNGFFGSNSTAAPNSYNRPSFAARHPFLTGFAGGLIGAGVFGMLSGHGFFGGFTGGGSFFGFLFQVLVFAGIIILVIRLWRKPKMPSSNGATPFSNNGPVTLSSQDYTEFQRILVNIQAAWSAQNINALRQLATPEMASYFGEQLSELNSRGARNVVSNVQFLQGDLSEAWREGSLTYATVAMRYSMIDVTTDPMGNVIDGSQTEPQTVTELWTFVRADGRGNWILSAIQQGS
ncbi:TIM44-like domain-containing protein [Saccharibacter sp. 17.LH.SD]|uniref:Tim44 domain-containing protein n=1 Tax=Saccharibacter sp. 17.LH.SD TaxID=2689393 RepID=UPI001370099D|nr:Tim44-like domain-containing protein [Saccharibacter sp. 17.LH.SD]MXV44135.1 TIM44-like domain-containing protein [Saccharibacter sp. 17.LH.SD]